MKETIRAWRAWSRAWRTQILQQYSDFSSVVRESLFQGENILLESRTVSLIIVFCIGILGYSLSL